MIWFFEFTLNGILIYSFGTFIYDIVTAIALLFCISAIVCFYTAINLESKRHQHQITTPQYETNSLRQKEFKAAKTTALVLGCFFNMIRTHCHCYNKYLFYFSGKFVQWLSMGVYHFLAENIYLAGLTVQSFDIQLACSRDQRTRC